MNNQNKNQDEESPTAFEVSGQGCFYVRNEISLFSFVLYLFLHYYDIPFFRASRGRSLSIDITKIPNDIPRNVAWIIYSIGCSTKHEFFVVFLPRSG